ncbi:MAG: hypothetical protein KBD66_02795 [Candidatus Doudnabacteria bacterium]|nr:hypothetical protein [Candidatus Doudnabacteria bacterium]
MAEKMQPVPDADKHDTVVAKNKAVLIKRDDAQQHIANLQAAEAAREQLPRGTATVVDEWKAEHGKSQKLSPREQFAALFANQTSAVEQPIEASAAPDLTEQQPEDK